MNYCYENNNNNKWLSNNDDDFISNTHTKNIATSIDLGSSNKKKKNFFLLLLLLLLLLTDNMWFFFIYLATNSAIHCWCFVTIHQMAISFDFIFFNWWLDSKIKKKFTRLYNGTLHRHNSHFLHLHSRIIFFFFGSTWNSQTHVTCSSSSSKSSVVTKVQWPHRLLHLLNN